VKARALLAALVACALACAALDSRSTPVGVEKTHWTLASLGAGRAAIPETQSEAFIVIGAEPGRVSGSGGCNRLAAGYELDGRSLEFGAIAGTRMACEHGMEVEAALSSTLESTASFRVVGEQLELYDAAGVLLATFEADPGE